MGVSFVDKQDENKDFRISIWDWGYFLGMFEQSGVVPNNVLQTLQTGQGGNNVISKNIAQRLAAKIREIVLSHVSVKGELGLASLPHSTAKTATFANAFVNALIHKKGYPNNSLQVSTNYPSKETIMGFICFCEQSNGFAVL